MYISLWDILLKISLIFILIASGLFYKNKIKKGKNISEADRIFNYIVFWGFAFIVFMTLLVDLYEYLN